MLWPESNYHYSPLTHQEAGDVLAALWESAATSLDEQDQMRVERLLQRVEACVDIVLVERHPSRAGEMRGTSILPGGPAGGDSPGGDVS